MTTQFFFAAKNSPIAFKVCPYKADDTQVVLKARHPEVGSIAAQICGATVMGTEKGSHYFLTYVNKAEFFQGFGKLTEDVFEGNVAILPPKSLQDVAAGPAIPVVSSIDDIAEELDDDEDDDSEDY